MAPHIVSWSDNETSISPALSSAASIVSLDSTFSNTDTSLSQMSLTASGLPNAGLGANPTNLPDCSEGRTTAGGGHVTPNDSFIRHDAYFFKDGNVTFLIDGMLYCVHRYFFSRDSVYFSTRFAQLGIHDHEALPSIISIGDVKRYDFEALLSVLYPTNFEAHELTYEQWKSVLQLSTRWGFASLRELALNSIKPPTSHDQLVLARTYSVDHWVLPALTALCSKTLPLSLNEARQMSMEDVILVAMVREEIRGGELRVDAADIPCHIKMAQAGKPIRPVVNKAHKDKPNSKTTEKQHRGTKEGDLNSSSEEVPAESPEKDAGQGFEQPHASEGTPQGCPVKNVATPAMQTRGMRKLASPGAVAPLAEAVLAENRGARVRQEAEAEIMHRLEAQAAEERAHAEEKLQAEATCAKEKADAEAKKAAAEARKAEAYAKRNAEARTKAESTARAKAEAKAAKDKAEAEAVEYIERQRAADKVARATAASASSPINPPGWGLGRSRFERTQVASVAASAIISTDEPALPPKSTSPWHSDPWSKKNRGSGGNPWLSTEEPAPPKSSGSVAQA